MIRKTVRGYIELLKRLERNPTICLKGYGKLSKEKQEMLGVISAEISNNLNEYLDLEDEE